jgi:DNA-binding PadR family transcriptional regulator
MGHHHMHGERGRGPREFGPGFGGDAGDGTPGERGVRRQRGLGGPPPWLGQMFGPGFGQAFGQGRGGFGPGGPGGPGGRRGRGPRARRGDVRAAILEVLAASEQADNGQQLNGYQVIQAIAERTDGAWKPSPGSVYPTIQQLEDEDLVSTGENAGRKVIALTETGRAYVAEHPDEMAAVWAPFAEDAAEGDDGGDLKKVIGQTMAAVWQVASTGTSAQVAEAAEVLAETRRKLYTILAEGDSE